VRTIVAIDPGSRFTGIAIIQGPRIWSMVMHSQTTAEIDAFVLACIAVFGTDVEFVLEDQYLAEHKDPNAAKGERGKVNWPSVVKLVAARVRWQTIAELRGVRVWLANTGAWQGKMHGTVPKRDAATGKERTRKQRSKIVVERTWKMVPRIERPADVLDPDLAPRKAEKATRDEADAACIGRFHQLYGGTAAVEPKAAPAKAAKPKPTAAPKPKIQRAPRKTKPALEVVPA
jgi:hypothetical protein